ncbi:MAG: pectin acetylesterase-family hydrolase [Bacillota bacterium]|nr:pectin acetylesterase-family hydrolase [Bacillota bacterium]
MWKKIGILCLAFLTLVSCAKIEKVDTSWQTIRVEEAYSSDGSDWNGLYKKGTENKTIVYFVGGGMSFSRNMDKANALGFFEENLWYINQLSQYALFANVKENPFRNWNFVVIPYSTGDLHIGNVIYEEEDGNRTYHQGYKNFKLFMEQIKDELGNPDSLIITGSSAGGFGAALLAEDVLEYFPNTKNIVTMVDAGFLIYEDWKDCAQNFWEAPEHIVNRIHSNNIVLDSLESLHKNREDVKILFACSSRDSALQAYQNFVDTGVFEYSIEAGDRFFLNLKEMVKELKAIDCGLYIFDTIVDEEFQLTRHMVLPNNPFAKRVENTSVVEWICDALEGNLRSYGLYVLAE